MADVPSNLSAASRGLTHLACNAAYVAVGLGVMGFQRAQVRRVDLQRRVTDDLALERRVGDLRDGAVRSRAVIDDLAGSAVHLVGDTLQPLEGKVPAAVTSVTAVVRDRTRHLRIAVHRGRR
jgi:hypothetical protein